jgi:hypothetical protein
MGGRSNIEWQRPSIPIHLDLREVLRTPIFRILMMHYPEEPDSKHGQKGGTPDGDFSGLIPSEVDPT